MDASSRLSAGKLGEYIYGCLVLLIYLLALRGSFGTLST